MIYEPTEEYGDEPALSLCKHCGRELEWIECDQCGGEGYFDWETLQDEDPLWYGPDDTERCEQCRGDGGWWWCDNQECPRKQETAQNASEGLQEAPGATER
jgi:hypothetical protein